MMNTNKLTAKDHARIMAKVQIDPETECWDWAASTTSEGYPHVWLNGSVVAPQRILFKLFNPTTDIEGLSVRPACGNPLCVNPDHQTLQAHVSVRNRKLTPEDVSVIKRLLDRGAVTQTAIATMFGVSGYLISSIKNGNEWSSVQI